MVQHYIQVQVVDIKTTANFLSMDRYLKNHTINLAQIFGDWINHNYMPNYSKTASDKVEKVMHEKKKEPLKAALVKK